MPASRLWVQARAARADAERAGWRVVIPQDKDWPAGLADLGGWQPVCLWAHGPAPIPQPATSVTVVGSRAATSYGQNVAADLAFRLTDRTWTVVSTPALGVDGAALRAALAAGTGTGSGGAVAVLPHGLDQIHPAAHANLFSQLADRGLLLSAWPAGAQLTRERVKTNLALVAALTAGTVVVEASLRSDALGVAHHALEAGRPCRVVPGPITSAMSAGCHELLRAQPHARLVTGVDDIVADLRRIPWPASSPPAEEPR
ncbi:DNA-processing protein DprA [Phytohabitans sp. LJ34]|uniref:DNA-processing protein DprA n=1 Tax=Phytohabitans sp. LJ34 TaxID=3452217 RepID=UPI003F8ACFA3